PQHDHHRKRYQPHSKQHRRPDTDNLFDLTMDAETYNDPVERHRDDDRFEEEGDRRSHIQMWRLLNISLPGDREREDERMHGVDIEQRIETILVKLQEAHQHEGAGKHVSNIEGNAVHQRLRDTNRRSVARSPSINAAPRNSGTRNTRIFA